MSGSHVFIVEWRGVFVTVECEAESDEEGLTMLPVRVQVNDTDITRLVNIEDWDLADIVQRAYDYNGRCESCDD